MNADNALVKPVALYNPARIWTDKDDYYPEEPVLLDGSGWKANEDVYLFVVDSATDQWTYKSTVKAGANGTFAVTPYFIVEQRHLGVTFDVTAYGAESTMTADVRFTDSNKIGAVSVSAQSGTLTQGTGGSATYTVTVTRATGATGKIDATITATGLTSGATALPLTLTVPNGQPSGNGTLTINTNSSAAAGTTQFAVRAETGGSGTADFATNTGTLKIDNGQATTALSAANANGTYGGTASLSATLTSGGSGVSGKTIAFTLNGTSVGSAATNGSGIATLSSANLTGINAGTYLTGVGASFAGDGSYAAKSGTAQLTVTKATASITVTPYDVSYDGAEHVATGSATGVGGVTLTGLNLNGTKHTNAGTYSDTWTFTGPNGNYNDATSTVTNKIAKINATVTVTPYDVSYDGSEHVATGSATGIGGVTLTGLNLNGTKHIDAGTYTDTWVFTAPNANYNDATSTVTDKIAKKAATITLTNLSQTYNGTARSAGATTTPADLNVTFTYDGSATPPTNAGSYTVVGTISDTNHSGSANGTFNIAKANATIAVNGYTGTYDGNAHGATGSAKGVNDVDLSSLLNLGGSFTDAPGGTATWSFAGNTNYNSDSDTAAIVISKADATVSVTGYTGTYDGDPHGATGSATGVKGESLSGLDLGDSFTDVPGDTANWSFAASTNYKGQSGTAAIVINKADATVSVTGYTGTYNGNAHGATGSATGVKGESLSGLDPGDSFADVPGGTANWSFAASTNYKGQSGTAAIVINKADATVSVTGYTGT
ncbi:MAG: Ig-like domain repeat protein, partial [Chthoniobacterales bacterium]|nr:Ig-like domain repeat protein [Chthoniobacterales bacterium]